MHNGYKNGSMLIRVCTPAICVIFLILDLVLDEMGVQDHFLLGGTTTLWVVHVRTSRDIEWAVRTRTIWIVRITSSGRFARMWWSSQSNQVCWHLVFMLFTRVLRLAKYPSETATLMTLSAMSFVLWTLQLPEQADHVHAVPQVRYLCKLCWFKHRLN